MPDSKSKKRPAEPVIDFDEAMKYPPLAVSASKRGRRVKSRRGPGKESIVSKNLDLNKIRAGLRTHHGGPGPHKDGSSQDVHGKKGAGGAAGSKSRPRPPVFPARPQRNSHYHGNLVMRDENPAHRDLLGRIDSRDTGQPLAFGFKVGDGAWATLDDGEKSEIGILRHYEDDHFYLELDPGIVEVYKTKIHKETD